MRGYIEAFVSIQSNLGSFGHITVFQLPDNFFIYIVDGRIYFLFTLKVKVNLNRFPE